MSRRQLLHIASPQSQGVTFLYQLQHIVEEYALWATARESLPRNTNGECETIYHVSGRRQNVPLEAAADTAREFVLL